MANTVAYTSTNSPTGSLKKGVISINLNNQIIGQNYNWRNGIVFQNQYIIYSDTFTQGIDTEVNAKPCAWSCDYNDTALLNLINSLPPLIGQAKYSTLVDAIAWLEGQNKYFIVNQNYPTIVTDGLKFNLDAGLTGSYPVVGTTSYDVVGSTTGSITNGVAWTNSGATSYFTFDGTDDYINFGDVSTTEFGTGNFTLSALIFIPSNVVENVNFFKGLIAKKGAGGADAGYAVYYNTGQRKFLWSTADGSNAAERFSVNTWESLKGRWSNIVMIRENGATNNGYFYINGVYENISSSASVLNVNNNFNLTVGASSTLFSNYFFQGNIKMGLIYDKALSQSEVLQNYYQGPIVTSGLVAAYDSGNLVSYPGTSTTWYDMAGTDNGTLINGITYTINSGGILNFDGTDDYVQTSSTLGNLGSGDWTFSVWWKANGTQSDFTSLISQGFTGGISSGAWALKVKGTSVQNFINFSFATAFETITDVQTSTNANDGNWHNIVVKRSVNTCTLYMDGQSVGTFNVSGGFVFGTGANTFIGYTPRDAAFILGNLGIVMKYNRAISDSEMLQNYYAHLNRFQSNQAFAIGGTVSSVIENGVKYRVHTFTSSGTLTVLSSGKVESLVVAGGGGGGGNHAGGGGAGGLIYNTDYSVTTGNKTVTVGAGGSKSTGFQLETGQNGNNSVFDDITTLGGGGGGNRQDGGPANLQFGKSGGSGGGSGGQGQDPTPNLWVGGAGTVGQGSNGGSATFHAGGGGGGAGGDGAAGTTINGGSANTFPGNGGIGKQISINGTPTYYAGGGGGGGYIGGPYAGTGGLGGGGEGQKSTGQTVNGTANTGGGGGGADGGGNANGGNGGSGIVIIRYRI
jgi:hypothetical protein